jgi:hypothetical protein
VTDPVQRHHVLLTETGPQPIDASTATFAFVGGWVLAQLASLVVLAATGYTVDDPPIWVFGVVLAAAWTVSLGAVVVASRLGGSGHPAVDVGLAGRTSDLLGVPIGVLSQLVLVPVLYVPLERIWPDTFSGDKVQQNAEELVDRAGGSATVLLVLLVVVGAPFVEEVVYRGLLQRSYLARFHEPVVVVVVAFVFAALHVRPVELPGLFAFGIVLGLCAARTDRLGMPIVAHVAFNATGLALAF